MKPFNVRIGIPQQGLQSVTVIAANATEALLFALEAAPDACYISVKAAS